MDSQCFLTFFCLHEDLKDRFFAPALQPGDFPESRNLIHGPRISVSARNDLFPRVQEEKGLGTSHLISHAPAHTHSCSGGKRRSNHRGRTVVPVIGRNSPRTQTHTNPPIAPIPFKLPLKLYSPVHYGRGRLEVMRGMSFYGDSNEQMRSSARTQGCDTLCASLCPRNSEN